MMYKKFIAAVIAASTAIVPFSSDTVGMLVPSKVCAEESVEFSNLPSWIPNDFESALAFRNSYGTVFIAGGYVCFVFTEERKCEFKGNTKDEPHYSIHATEGVMTKLKDETYGTKESDSDYEVVVYQPVKAGDFEISLVDNWVKSSSLEPETGYVCYRSYNTFSVDENLNVTETDRFSWMPDCLGEYNDFVKQNGEVSVKDNFIIFCYDSAVGTPYTWQQMFTGFSDHADLYDYVDCSEKTAEPLDGGTMHLMKIFQATNDGYVQIGLEYREDLIGTTTTEPEKRLFADCVVLDNAQTVLLKGQTRATIIDSETGEPVSDDKLAAAPFKFHADIVYGPDLYSSIGSAEPAYTISKNSSILKEKNICISLSCLAEAYKKADSFKTNTAEQPEIKYYDNGAMDLIFRTNVRPTGNINGDSEFSVADAVALQKWLLCDPDASISNWAEADYDHDGQLTVFDLIIMKKELVKKAASAYVEPDNRVTFSSPFYVEADELKLYLGPDESYVVIDSIPKSIRLREIGYNQNNANWLFTEYNGKYGWIKLVEEDGTTPTVFFEMMPDKPVIYLYPEKETDVHVELELTESELSTTYPKYNDGWDVTAYPDGRLLNKADGTHHRYLFWDAVNCRTRYDFSKGFCVAGNDTESFLREKLTYMGLTEEEMNEFIVYWLPRMEHNKYNLISFQGDAYTDSSKLNITPEPDSICRIFMTYVPLENAVDIAPQQLETFERKGFAVIEWGGSEIIE